MIFKHTNIRISRQTAIFRKFFDFKLPYSGSFKADKLPYSGSFRADAEEGEEGVAEGEDGGDEHGVVGGAVAREVEEEGDEGGSGGLPGESGGGEHAAGAAGAVVGG